jgi:hypothetical protein
MGDHYAKDFSTLEERIEHHINTAVTLLGVVEGLDGQGELAHRYLTSANVHASIAQTLTVARVQNLAHAAIASMTPEAATLTTPEDPR